MNPNGDVVETLPTPDQTLVVVVSGRQGIEVLGPGRARRAAYHAGTSGLTAPGTAQRLRRLPGAGGGLVEKVNVYLPAALMAEVAEHYRTAGSQLRSVRLSTLACQDRTTTEAALALARGAAAGATDLYGQAGALWLATHLLSPDPHPSAATHGSDGPGPLLGRGFGRC